MSDKQDSKIRRTITPEIKIVDSAAGICEYIASDETCDWYNEVVLAKGWRFTHFAKNAPFVDSHNTWSIDALLGKVISFEIKDGKLIERVKWAIDVEDNKLAQIGWKMTEGEYLKAVSVGFMAIESVYRGGTGFEAVLETIECADPAKVRRIFTKHEQLELSACIIGANPNALAKSWEDGVVSNDDMQALGFGSDAAQDFLTKASCAYGSEECDQVMRSMIALEMQRTFAARTEHSPGKRNKGHGSTPTKRDAGEAAERRVAEQNQFLKSLGGIIR